MTNDLEFPILSPALQIGFYQRLKDAQDALLLPALLEHVSRLEIQKIDQELHDLVGTERLSSLTKKGLRGELVFPVPYVLITKPALLGYYRLLLGFSQKEFYKKSFVQFRSCEDNNSVTEKTKALFYPLCRSLIESAWILINAVPDLSENTLNALTLLTLGPQFRGSRNNNLGIEAIRVVFALLKSIVAGHIKQEGVTFLVIQSAANRIYRIEFASDPDIVIRQILPDGSVRNRIAIEIKGGTDFSNIHNRLGEAEKSHQKAKSEGFTEFWTVINVAKLDNSVWKRETPTTNELFYLEGISNTKSREHERFKEYLISELGI